MNSIFASEDEVPPRTDGTSPSNSSHGSSVNEDSDSGDIYKRLDSFERKMESELQDLGNFVVESSGKSKKSKKKNKSSSRKGQDPDGTGTRTKSSSSSVKTASTTASSSSGSTSTSQQQSNNTTNTNPPPSSFQKGKGRSGKNLALLSGKTNKIMSDYQAYLNQIQHDDVNSSFSSSSEDSNDKISELHPALANIHRARDDLRYSFNVDEESGSKHNGTIINLAPHKNDGYETGEGEPLYRAWSYENNLQTNHDAAYVFGEQVLLRATSSAGSGDAKRRKYHTRHPWLHSRRARRAVGIIVMATLLIGIIATAVTVSIGKSRNENLPDWEGEYEEEVEHEAEMQGEQNAAIMKSKEVMDRKTPPADDGDANQVLPAMMGESSPNEGWKQMSPAQLIVDTVEDDDDSKNNEPEVEVEVEVQDNEQQAESINQDTEKEAQDKTAQSLVDFMNAELSLEHQELINYHSKQEEIIAAAAANPPPASSEATLQNEEGTDGRLSVFWGDQSDQTTAEPTATEDLYYKAVMKYRPVMYDRQKGWAGHTYREALIFCNAHNGMAVCPYDAVCPITEGEPLGGYRDGAHSEMWMPITDLYNDYVQVAARDRCTRYSVKYGVDEGPEWGVTGMGEDVEGLTRNLMCCQNVM